MSRNTEDITPDTADAPQQRQGTRRPPPLIPILALLVTLAALLLAGSYILGCFGAGEGEEAGETTSVPSESPSSDEAVRLSAETGESLTVGDVVFQVNSLYPTVTPNVPDQTLERTEEGALREGEAFYQAHVWVANRGQKVVHVDPKDFELVAEDRRWRIDPGHTGPLPGSLLRGASVRLVVTFRAPVMEGVSLLYRPSWHPPGIEVTGMLTPLGKTSVEVPEK